MGVVLENAHLFPEGDFDDHDFVFTVKTPAGGAGGLDMTPRRFVDWDIQRALDTRSAIPNLWLTGQVLSP